MARLPTSLPDSAAGRIAAWSAAVGFMASLMVAAVSGRLLLDEQIADATTLGALGFSFAMVAPFVVVLASFIVRDLETRRAVWLASGVLSLGLAGLTLFSGVWLLFGPAGIGLIAAWWMARRPAGWLGPVRAIGITGWMLLWLGGALAVLWLRETPACWQVTATGSGWVAASSPNECASDIVDDLEGLLALAGVLVGLTGTALLELGGN